MFNRLTLPLVFGIALTAALGNQDSEDSALERDPLVLTYLANEGFLLEVGEATVLIDAFVGKPYAGYPALAKDVLERMRTASAPFDEVELALTSHVHGDHFQAYVAREFLAASPETHFVSTPQVITELRDKGKWEREDIVEQLPEAGGVLEIEHDGISVAFLRITHSGGMKNIENLGNLFEIGGHRVLHLGDADMNSEMFAQYEPILQDVDLALVPYWFFVSSAGRAILKQYLPAKAHVAMHIPTKDMEDVVASLSAAVPRVRVFTKSLETERFE
jgi:L-ascorbate metabolism protein UlaG (beta-lactamase superfamily)